MRLSFSFCCAIFLFLTTTARAGEIQIDAGTALLGSSWQGDFAGGGLLRLGYRFKHVIAIDLVGWEQLAAVNDRLDTGLTFGVTGFIPLKRVRPSLRLFAIHQHEEGLVSVAQTPAGFLFGIGSGIRHRAGGGLTLGAGIPFHHHPQSRGRVGRRRGARGDLVPRPAGADLLLGGQPRRRLQLLAPEAAMIRRTILLALALALMSCGWEEMSSRPCPDAGTTLTYESFGQPFFESFCISCHGGPNGYSSRAFTDLSTESACRPPTSSATPRMTTRRCRPGQTAHPRRSATTSASGCPAERPSVLALLAACAVCATVDSTLTVAGEEQPYRGRLRLGLDVREGHVEADGIRLDDRRVELAVGWAPLHWLEVGVAVPYLFRHLGEPSSTWDAVTLGDVELRARTLAYEARGSFGRRRFGLLGSLKMPTAPVAKDPAGVPLASALQPGCGAIRTELGGYFTASRAAWSTYVSASVFLPFTVRDAPHASDSLRLSAHVQFQPDARIAGRIGLFARVDANGQLAGGTDDPNSGGFVGYATADVVVSLVPDLVVTAGALLPVARVLRGNHRKKRHRVADRGVRFLGPTAATVAFEHSAESLGRIAQARSLQDSPHRMVAADDVFDSEPPTAGRRPRIVVADDNDDLRALLVAMLRLDGYEVIEASDGDAVVRLMREATRMPDAIITDVCMPTVSGLSVLAALRANGWQTPVILLTALGAEPVRARATELGADVVVGKPFDARDLRTVVMNVLWPMTTLM